MSVGTYWNNFPDKITAVMSLGTFYNGVVINRTDYIGHPDQSRLFPHYTESAVLLHCTLYSNTFREVFYDRGSTFFFGGSSHEELNTSPEN